MLKNLTSQSLSLRFSIFFVSIIAIVYYPFLQFFSGKWEARPTVTLITFEQIKNYSFLNNSFVDGLLDFLQQNGIDSFGFRYYSLMLFVGITIAFYLLIYFFQKISIYGIIAEKTFITLLILGLIGTRLLFVLLNYNYYFSKPIEIINFQQGGLSLYGGIIIVSLYLLLVAKKTQTNYRSLLDALTPSCLMIMIWARFGNFFNYESYGQATALPWKMYVPEGAVINNRYNIGENLELFYHPLFLYEILFNIILFLLISYFYDFVTIYYRGFITGFFIIAYGVLRFLLEYIRLDVNRINDLLTVGQVFSLAGILAGLILVFLAVKDRLNLSPK